MGKLDRYSKQLLETFRGCQYTDILGFGNILEVNDNQDFDDYLTEIIVNFQNQSRSKRKALLKLAKDVAAANKGMAANPKLINSEKFNKIKGKEIKFESIDEFDRIDQREILKEKTEQASKFLSTMNSTQGDN